MKKILVGIIIFLIILIITPFALLGMVPFLSPLIGAGPRDLGIRITAGDSAAARAKVGTEIVALPKGTAAKDDFVLKGKENADFTMDSKELTAHSNNRPWKNYPVKNIQIKIRDDGTIESSGVLVIAKAMPYAMALGYSENQIRDAMQKYNIPPFEVPFYVLGKGSVANDAVTVDASEVRIGAIPIPGAIVAQANREAEGVLNDIIRKHAQAFHAEEVSFGSGRMTFKGQVPLKEYVITQ